MLLYQILKMEARNGVLLIPFVYIIVEPMILAFKKVVISTFLSCALVCWVMLLYLAHLTYTDETDQHVFMH